MIKEVDKFGNSNIYTKVYTKVEGVGDISRERVIHRQSVSQGIPTRTCDIYTKCIPIRYTSGLYVRYKLLAVYIGIAKHMQSTEC